jgi:two-component system response regulator
MSTGKRGQRTQGEPMDLDIRILLVEDDLQDAAVTKHVLSHNKLDNNLIIATSGKDALAALQNGSKEDLPQLILLDINLPDISGIDLLRRIKRDENLQEIPVVILTGSNEDQDIQKSYDLGAGSYLVKPISNKALMLVIEKIFYP